MSDKEYICIPESLEDIDKIDVVNSKDNQDKDNVVFLDNGKQKKEQ